jgi:hypothetical protein
MSVMDEMLQKFGLKYEDLKAGEREVLSGWMQDLSKNQLTVEKIKAYIERMRDEVEIELTKTEHNSKQDLFLKARLRNYMLLDAFMISPARAKRAIEEALMGMSTTKKR